MSDPHATVTINVHETPEAIIAALARVFPLTTHEGSRWVAIQSDGVTATFFASRETPDSTTAA
jgi:hypothetical protein